MSDGMAGFTAGHMLTLNPAFYQVFISALFFLRFRLPVRFYVVCRSGMRRLNALPAGSRGTSCIYGNVLVTFCFSHEIKMSAFGLRLSPSIAK